MKCNKLFKCNSEIAIRLYLNIIILAQILEIRQFKMRQNFSCLFQSKSAKISRRQNNPIYGNMLMCLHLKVRHYDFNIKIYCICFLSYKLPLFWTHTRYLFLINWANEHVTFWACPFFRSIPDGLTSLTVLSQQLDVIIEGVLWAIRGKWECSSWSLSFTDDLLWL